MVQACTTTSAMGDVVPSCGARRPASSRVAQARFESFGETCARDFVTSSIVPVCVDRELSWEELTEAADRAVAENPANAPSIRVRPGLGVRSRDRMRAALVTSKKWSNGRSLRVRFMDGDPAVQARVEQLAHQWSNFANIKFQFGTAADAEIRISFQLRGSWSYLGTDALTIARNRPTMNFGWLTPASSDTEFARVVLHEFGHALGLIHEHQNPTGNIPWDKDKVYAYYMGPPNNWTKADVDRNLFQKYSASETQFSQFDAQSIMLYPIPNEHTIGDYAVGWNSALSATDKSFILAMYPTAARPTVRLTVGAAPLNASIANHGEEDLYEFDAATAGRFTIATNGPTDVVMTVFGPNSSSQRVAEDDDSGPGPNALIQATLAPGKYFV